MLPVEVVVWLSQAVRVIWIWATVENVEDAHVANDIVDLEQWNTELKTVD